MFSVNAAVSFSTLFVETVGLKSLLALSQNGSATQTAFTNTPTVMYLRRERTDRHHIANVFDEAGVKIYTIERRTMFTPVWSVLTVGERREIATLHAGLVNRYFDLHCKPDIRHREIQLSFGAAGATRQFHLNDGAGYEWNSSSRFLERVINPGGGDEEVRQRVAKARQMRTMRFDFEILIDETLVDREVAIITAYIAMLTQWGIGSYIDTRGPTLVGIPVAKTAHLDPESHAVQLTYDDESSLSESLPESDPIAARRLMLEDRQVLSLEGSDSQSDHTTYGKYSVAAAEEESMS